MPLSCVIMLSVVRLSVFILSVIMLSVVMLSDIMLSVIMLNVVAPFHSKLTEFFKKKKKKNRGSSMTDRLIKRTGENSEVGFCQSSQNGGSSKNLQGGQNFQ